MKALTLCANGCDVPPAPPSKVLCKSCMDKLTVKFRRWAEQGYDDQGHLMTDPTGQGRTRCSECGEIAHIANCAKRRPTR